MNAENSLSKKIQLTKRKVILFEAIPKKPQPEENTELLGALSQGDEDFTKCRKCSYARGIACGGEAIGVCEFLADVRFGSRNSNREQAKGEPLEYSHAIQPNMRCKLHYPDQNLVKSGLMCTGFNLGVLLAKDDLANVSEEPFSAVKAFRRYKSFTELPSCYDLADFDSSECQAFFACVRAGIEPIIAVAIVGARASFKEALRSSVSGHEELEKSCSRTAVKWLQSEDDTITFAVMKKQFDDALWTACSLAQ